MSLRKHNIGFHLFEILLVLTLTGILCHAMFAKYQRFIIHEKRRAAIIALHELSAALDDYAMTRLSYRGATFTMVHVSESAAANSYSLVIDEANENYYRISAHPGSRQIHDDLACGILSLNSRGEKNHTGSASLHECWNE